MTDQPDKPRFKVWQIIAGAIIVLILISLVIPGVRASISSWLGISVAPAAQVTISPVTLEAIATSSTPTQVVASGELSTPTPGSSSSSSTQSITLSMVQAASTSGTTLDLTNLTNQTGWNVLVPSFIPEGYQFQSAYFDTTNKMLALTYLVTRPLPGATDPALTSSETITLLEAKTNNYVPMQIAPNTNVEDVQVNGVAAAFTLGGWDTQFIKDNSLPGGGKMVSSWRNDLPVKNLYWQAGDIYYLLVTADESVTQQDLVDMAASVGK
jgi:hypothetical protein